MVAVMTVRAEEAVLITGVFGTGKTSVAVEIADMCEKQGLPYAVLDLDWLMWFNLGGEAAGFAMMLRNLTAVVDNYREAGARFFILARAIRDADELERVRSAMAMPVRVVRLEVALPEIERRLLSDVTTSRLDDLREAGEWLEAGEGVGIEDLLVTNDRPIHDVAEQIVEWLGWAVDSPDR
jgi:KaiC/GvpD/RAD55 family RecA-like ATPase